VGEERAQTARVESSKAKVTEQSAKIRALLMKTKAELKLRNEELEKYTQGSADLVFQVGAPLPPSLSPSPHPQ